MPNLFEKYSPQIHTALRRGRGDTVTFQPGGGDPIQLELLVSFPDPEGQRPTSQVVNLYAELAALPRVPAKGDQFMVPTPGVDIAGVAVTQQVTYIVYETRRDELLGIWIDCRRA
jgi:hypothetical protein